MRSCVMGFSSARWSPNPHSSCGFGFHCLLFVDLVKIDTLLYLSVFGDVDESGVDCRRDSHLNNLGVTSGDVAFLVASCGFDPEAPRAFDPCIFFVTVVIGSIIDSTNFKMAARALFFQMCHTYFLTEVQKVLYVNGAVVAALQLPRHVLYLRGFTPRVEIILRRYDWIVASA